MKSLNRSIMNNETKASIKGLPTKQRTGLDRFIVQFDQVFQLPSMLPKLFHETPKNRLCANLCYDTGITLTPKPDKEMT